jgi:hypothetical protein
MGLCSLLRTIADQPRSNRDSLRDQNVVAAIDLIERALRAWLLLCQRASYWMCPWIDAVLPCSLCPQEVGTKVGHCSNLRRRIWRS